ncbi:unnamed protein product [Auanema sp. JU1783]|nr:unnamed protein product [Auanema sp. JU1783]
MFLLILSSLIFLSTQDLMSSNCAALWQLDGLSECVIHQKYTAYQNYGCVCSNVNPQTPLDNIDRCCASHIQCYNNLMNNCANPDAPNFCSYRWTCDSSQIICEKGLLYNKLLEEYEPLERPVENASEPVKVKIGLALQQIITVDEKNQVVDVNAWLKLTWHDYSLKWNPDEHGGVTDLRFRKSQLWTPDVLMYNSADPQFDSTYASNVLVYPDGTANWIPPGLFRLSCRIEIVWFPFDIQECFMKFGSWTFDGFKLELDIDENALDTSTYIPNGEWHLVSTNAVRNIQYYQCCPEPYYDVIFTFVIRRRVLYYAFNLILPCILITLLTLIGFTLPPDAGEKMSLQITIMLSICIFQNYVAEMSPPTSEAVPFLGAFFAVCMFTCACCVTATTMALNFHNRSSRSHEMSYLFRLIMINFLPWLLCMHRPGYKAGKGQMIKIESETENETDDELDEDDYHVHDDEKCDSVIEESHLNRMKKEKKNSKQTSISIQALMSKILVDSPVSTPRVMRLNEETGEVVNELAPGHLWRNGSKRQAKVQTQKASPGFVAQLLILQQIHSHMIAINTFFREKEEEKAVEDDWKFSAMVVDRLCLFIFSFFILFSTIGLFASVPQLSASF